MIPGFDKIIEERIRKAQKEGEFDDLPGKGQPLDLDELKGVSEELRLAYKILKNADCKPPEIEIKEEIRRTEDLLQGMGDTRKKVRLIKKLNFLIMKLNTMRQGSAEFEMPQVYESKLVDRLADGGEAKKSK